MLNTLSNQERAEVLTQALPYIKRYTGQTVVIKYGGNAMVNEQLKQQVTEDIVFLWLIGVRVVLVHGGGPEINDMMQRLGKVPVFADGLRVTDKETVDIVQLVLAGKVNKTLVSLLESKGGRAIGISGMDGRLIECCVKDEKLGYTLGCDREGNVYNINGDTAAAAIAGALGAKRFVLMTDVAGIMRDKNDPETLIPEVSLSEIDSLLEEGVISDGMIPKVNCCADAIRKGVQKVVIMDGRVPHAILMELLTNEGAGTLIKES